MSEPNATMAIECNSIINASAGTGKTFALASRFIRLMMFDKVKPEAIIALTFSRAAAQEIYEKILKRLADASIDDENAEKEWNYLLKDFEKDENGEEKVPQGEEKLRLITAANIRHDKFVFRNLLRKLVESQHLGTIATIDSFILRFIQNFPTEMGFQNAVEVIDPIDESVAVDDALKRALACNDGKGSALAKAFRAANDGDFSRTCIDSISRILSGGWRSFVIAHPECKDWTVESMCDALDVPMESACPDLSGIPVNEIKRKNATAPEARFINDARTYDGHESFLTGNLTEDLIRFFWENPDATSWTYSFYRRDYVLDCGAEGAAAIRGAIQHMMNLHLKHMLEKVKAKIDLVKAVEDEYSRMTRRAGRLTFDDFTKFTAENEFSKRGIAIKNLQFRFDSRFDHWALDEFQDTSELQWKCLKEFVSEVAAAGREGNGRSAMAVGDLKQSIYTWRGASALPFNDISTWSAFEGCSSGRHESYRYGPNITGFINRVFGRGNISVGGIMPEVCNPAVKEWYDGWKDHRSNQPEDFIRVLGATKDEDDEEDDEILPTLRDELKKLWEIHERENSTDTVGVLVRANDDGVEVAEYLRRNGLPAVWEGVNTVHDLPVIQAILALLKLADHPEDSAAWQVADQLYAVRERVFPDFGSAASVSKAVSCMLSRQGLARTLKDICEKLGDGFGERSIAPARIRQLVEMGSAFEDRSAGGCNVDEFVAFLEKSTKREHAASAKVIKVLSIHRSKGLGIDHVFVPLFERHRDASAIDRPKANAPLYNGEQKWVLPHLKKGTEAFNSKTRCAYDKMCSDAFRDALRTYYVALTRAKKSMFVIFPNDSNPADYGKGLLMRDLIVNAVGVSYEAGKFPTFKDGKKVADSAAVRDTWEPMGWREVVERVSPSGVAPSAHGRCFVMADSLFDSDFGAAAKKGIDVHAAYQRIEWADDSMAASLPAAFREAFVKPSPEATVWRERSYERFADGRWETGQFDRVVFTGAGDSRSAVIYDFKTSAKRESESSEAFAGRMRETYASQMKDYRKALAALTGIPHSRITAKLLLASTGASVLVSDGLTEKA